MNQHAAQQMFGQAEKLFKDARVPEQVQAIAQEGVAKSRELYVKSTAAAQEGAKLMTEVAETAWSSTKVLNDKLTQNLTANTAAMFDAAQAMAKAGSLPELPSCRASTCSSGWPRAARRPRNSTIFRHARPSIW